MKCIYGRFNFDKLDRVENCIRVYATFKNPTLAKEYYELRMCDIAPNTVDFIYDGKILLFASKKNNRLSWEELNNTVVFNCTNDEEMKLTNCLITEREIIKAIFLYYGYDSEIFAYKSE